MSYFTFGSIETYYFKLPLNNILNLGGADRNQLSGHGKFDDIFIQIECMGEPFGMGCKSVSSVKIYNPLTCEWSSVFKENPNIEGYIDHPYILKLRDHNPVEITKEDMFVELL